eukprot:TRINITY_DN29_c0_g1_i3.p1 TRINITY_DN29_c0_g1~~TRINITY_DN29_c0_g1_i3.p1  ORF type:complete len:834 (+),score=192.25 TRINITY_DN29_c0_g1_i3:77-2578(+)
MQPVLLMAALGAAASPLPISGLSDAALCAPPECCSLKISDPALPLAPLKVCANHTCVWLPEVDLPGVTTMCLSPDVADCVGNQTASMTAASGVKFGGLLGFTGRVVTGALQLAAGMDKIDLGGKVIDPAVHPMVQGVPPDTGDVERCRASSGDSYYCLWGGQFLLAAGCMPKQCTPDLQLQAVLYQITVWDNLANAIKKLAPIFGMNASSVDGLVNGLTVFSALTRNLTSSAKISCGDPLIRIGAGTYDDADTLQKSFSDDKAAQAVAGIVIGLACVCVLSTLGLRIEDIISDVRTAVTGFNVQDEDTRALCSPGSSVPGVSDSATHPSERPMSADHAAMVRVEKARPRREGFAYDLMRCFDLVAARDNFLKISPRRETSFLNGMRVFSILWVVLGHVLVYPSAPGFDNMSELNKEYLPKFRMVFLGSAFYAVDTFFFMSGFLACYSFTHPTKGWKKRVPNGEVGKTIFNTLMVYVDRYVRLTPLYALLIFFAAYLLQYFGSGPFWAMAKDGGDVGAACAEYWYSNILYINNFPPYTDGHLCFGHSWYLANDMQFLVVGTPIMILFTHQRLLAWAVTAALMIASWTVILIREDNGRFAPTGLSDYMRPYIRAAPYLYGLMACYVVRSFRPQVESLIFRPAVRMITYLLTFGLMFGALVWQWKSWSSCGSFATCESDQLPLPEWADLWGAPQTRAFSWYYHFAWGLGLLVLTVVWSCGAKQGLGGWVVDFLSYPLFEPLYRLTYGVYLIHPIVLLCIKNTGSHQNHYTDYWLLSTWIAASVGSYTASLLAFLFVERPSSMLWDMLSGRSKRRAGGERRRKPEQDPLVEPKEQTV